MVSYGTVESISGKRCGVEVRTAFSPRLPFGREDGALLIFVRRGELSLFASRETHRLGEGDAAFVDENKPFAVRGGEGSAFLLRFPRRLLDGFADGRTLASPVLRNAHAVGESCARIAATLERGDGAQAVCLTVGLFAAIFAEAETVERRTGATEARLSELLREIAARNGDMTFAEGRAFMGMTDAYFSRFFKAASGMTFSAHLNCVRVARAASLLDRRKRMADVAAECGFATVRNFNRTFREITGFVPKRLPRGFYDESTRDVSAERRACRIAVIATGGTVGSVADGGVLGVRDDSAAARLIEACRARGSDDVFTVFTPVRILSENMTPEALTAIVDCLGGLSDGFDGVIVTHGTDTMSFTAAVLAQAFADTRRPIVLVGALVPLDDPRTDGFANFDAAVSLIAERIPGVFVCAANGDGCDVHLASRVVAARAFDGKFESAGGVPFGRVVGGRFVPCAGAPSVGDLCRHTARPIPFRLCTDVLSIAPRALLDFTAVEVPAQVRAAVVRTYHSGTLCAADGKYSFFAFAVGLQERGIPVALACAGTDNNAYESTHGRTEKLLSLPYTEETTLAKCMLALGNGEDLPSFLAEERFFEKI